MISGFSNVLELNLRRGRDSNPRYRCQYDSLANCSFRPLRHLSYCRFNIDKFFKTPFRGCKYSNSIMFAKKNYVVCR